MGTEINSEIGHEKLKKLHFNLSEMNKGCKETIAKLKTFEEDPTMRNLAIALDGKSTFGTTV